MVSNTDIIGTYNGKIDLVRNFTISPFSRAYTFSDSIYEVIPFDPTIIKAIDIDKNNIDYLSKHFKGPAKFEFFQGDILSTPLNFLEDKK